MRIRVRAGLRPPCRVWPPRASNRYARGRKPSFRRARPTSGPVWPFWRSHRRLGLPKTYPHLIRKSKSRLPSRPFRDLRNPDYKSVSHEFVIHALFRFYFKLDALGERHFVSPAPEERVRLPAHVLLPAIRTGLAAAACFFLATTRAADLCSRRGAVHVGDSAVGTVHREEVLDGLVALR